MTPERMATIHAAAFAAIGARGWTAREFEQLLSDPTVLGLDCGTGFALIRVLPPEAEILTLAVEPAAQGQGNGRTLVGEVLSAAQKRGASELWLEVAADNRAALALYASCGFAETGRRPRYYARPSGPAVDAVVMRHKGNDAIPGTGMLN